jgi:hypothetical protein
MSIPAIPMQKINHFFETYARAIEHYDTKGMAYLYHSPCTLASDDSSTVFNDAGRLEGFFNMGVGFYRQFGIANVRHEIWNRREWTDRIVNVKVNWQYLDSNKAPIYNCDYQYVMKLDKNDHWKILLSVSVNEKERIEEWKGRGRKLNG